MKFYNQEKNNKVIQLLKKSKQDFDFNAESSKIRLMQSLQYSSPPAEETTIRHWPIWHYAIATACLLIFASATFTLASTARPGDKLFGLNKFREQVILKLPLNVETKAHFQTEIVSKRLEALDLVQPKVNVRLERVKESEESLNAAIEAVSTNKHNLEALGKTQAAARLSEVLNELEALASKNEKRIESLGQDTDDEPTRVIMQNHLRQVKEARKKAILELKSGQTPNQD